MISSIVYLGYVRIAKQQQEAFLEQLLLMARTGMKNEVFTIEQELLLLSSMPLSREVASIQDSSTVDHAKKRGQLNQIFLKLMKTNDSIEQLRLLDFDSGRELVRVDQRDGKTVVIKDDQLQNKANRDYFQQAKLVGDDQTYYSQVTLNREFGEIELPKRPMLRVARQVLGADAQPIGIVIINVNFSKLFQSQLQEQANGLSVMVTNRRGDYLIHPQEYRTFGFEYGKPQRLQDDYPTLQSFVAEAPLDQIATEEEGQEFLFARKVQLWGDQDPSHNLIAAIHTSRSLAGLVHSEVLRNAGLMTVFLVLNAALLGYLSAAYLTRPLQQITMAAKRLKGGELDLALPVDRDDEIGILARAFRRMATNVKEKESQLIEANEQLKTANTDLEHFTHLAAHDLREPLRKQSNLLELLNEELVDADEECHHLISLVNQCAHRMELMIRDFRRLTGVGEQDFVRQNLNLQEIVDRCVDDMEDVIQQRQVEVDVQPMPQHLTGYPSLLELLYANLISNALNHASGSFQLTFTAENQDGRWILGVRNTGSEIAPGKLTEVFKMFRTADNTLTGGTGVGLSLCKRIVDKHAGRIFAESGEGFVHIRFTLEGENGHPSKS